MSSDFDRDRLSVRRVRIRRCGDHTYNTDGTCRRSGPKVHRKWEYDAAGRRTKEIRHYDATVSEALGSDDNVA
jgi:hypothetical protein